MPCPCAFSAHRTCCARQSREGTCQVGNVSPRQRKIPCHPSFLSPLVGLCNHIHSTFEVIGRVKVAEVNLERVLYGPGGESQCYCVNVIGRVAEDFLHLFLRVEPSLSAAVNEVAETGKLHLHLFIVGNAQATLCSLAEVEVHHSSEVGEVIASNVRHRVEVKLVHDVAALLHQVHDTACEAARSVKVEDGAFLLEVVLKHSHTQGLVDGKGVALRYAEELYNVPAPSQVCRGAVITISGHIYTDNGYVKLAVCGLTGHHLHNYSAWEELVWSVGIKNLSLKLLPCERSRIGGLKRTEELFGKGSVVAATCVDNLDVFGRGLADNLREEVLSTLRGGHHIDSRVTDTLSTEGSHSDIKEFLACKGGLVHNEGLDVGKATDIVDV